MEFDGGGLNIYLVHTSVDAKLSPLFTARCFAALLVILALVGMLGLSTDEELSLLLNAWDKKKQKTMKMSKQIMAKVKKTFNKL